jgi:DNA-binding NtrC family response regulator
VTPLRNAGAAGARTGGPRAASPLVGEIRRFLARFLEQALTRAGYTVTACRDGGHALHVFRAAPDAVDVVVSDVAMPGLTGDVIARELRRLRPGLPVVLMTGFSHTVTAERARELGVAALLHKPVSARDLVTAVRDAMAGSTASEPRAG